MVIPAGVLLSFGSAVASGTRSDLGEVQHNIAVTTGTRTGMA
jgi:hypothetical protein